jgi:hypothetical protein
MFHLDMKTLTVDEAVKGLGHWVELAVAGEQIQIRKGNAVVELRPTQPLSMAKPIPRTPREALLSLQQNAHLTMEEADTYLRQVHEERLAADDCAE